MRPDETACDRMRPHETGKPQNGQQQAMHSNRHTTPICNRAGTHDVGPWESWAANNGRVRESNDGRVRESCAANHGRVTITKLKGNHGRVGSVVATEFASD
jgi:hypothetical protein